MAHINRFKTHIPMRPLSLLPRPLRHVTNRSAAMHFLRNHSTSPPSSVSSAEMTHFASLASTWWDPLGPSRILHLMNPLRHEFIGSCLSSTNTNQSNTKPGLSYLDIGCGGGIFAESLARTIPLDTSSSSSSTSTPSPTQTNASSLLAIDPSPTMIEIAQSHARKDPTLHTHLQSKRFQYKNTSLEALSASPSPSSSSSSSSNSPTFDMITLFEVLEHVDPSTSSPQSFIRQCLNLLNPGGWLIGSTIARTWPSYVVNQVIAEAPWPIGVVPRGTHEWGKFVNPDELKGWGERAVGRLGGGAGAGGMEMGMEWRCVGAVYVPGLGWKLVKGAESWGNYFWAIRKIA